MTHQASTTLKHISNPTYAQRVYAMLIKSGVAGYADRIALLKDAQRTQQNSGK